MSDMRLCQGKIHPVFGRMHYQPRLNLQNSRSVSVIYFAIPVPKTTLEYQPLKADYRKIDWDTVGDIIQQLPEPRDADEVGTQLQHIISTPLEALLRYLETTPRRPRYPPETPEMPRHQFA